MTQQIVPLIAAPNGTLTANMDGQNAQLNVYTLNTPGPILETTPLPTTELQGYPQVYVDLIVDGAPILSCKIAMVLVPLLLTSGYLGFDGELFFVDTQNLGLQNSTQLRWEGLGTQYQLIYEF